MRAHFWLLAGLVPGDNFFYDPGGFYVTNYR